MPADLDMGVKGGPRGTPAPPSPGHGAALTLQWMTTTCWGSLFSQDSCALQMVHTWSRGGACSSGQPTSRICNERRALSLPKPFMCQVRNAAVSSFPKACWDLWPGAFPGKEHRED